MSCNGRPQVRSGEIINIVFLGDSLDNVTEFRVMSIVDAREQVMFDLSIQAAGEFGRNSLERSESVGLFHLIATPINGMILRLGRRESRGTRCSGVLCGANDTINFVIDNKLKGEEKTGNS